MRPEPARTLVEPLRQSLLAAQNADGGWAAQAGRRSDTEATALAVLSLSAMVDSRDHAARQRGVSWLIARQKPDGSWPLADGVPEASWTTSLAALSLAGTTDERTRAVLGATWVLGQSGRHPGWVASLLHRLAPHRQTVQINPDLTGWPWVTATASWVEPTAYALLILKKFRGDLGANAVRRIAEAEQLLYDRMCAGGGWNFGTPREFGLSLPPYPEVTALVLTALQDRAATRETQLSLDSLSRQLDVDESGLALAWSVVCHSLHGRSADDLVDRLARSWARDRLPGGPRVVAVALLAVSGRLEPLRVDAHA